jgi:DNA polymerase
LKAVPDKVNTRAMVPPISQFAADMVIPGPAAPADLSARALAGAIDAALTWWRDAGVDGDFTDTPLDWLTAASQSGKASAPAHVAPARTPPPEPAVVFAGGREAWPRDLQQFCLWWMAEPDLAPAGAIRIPPSGPESPALMVVVPMPEAADSETLLSGPAGRVLDGLLAAAGLSRPLVYCAAALPSRIAAPDWTALAQQGMGDVLAHHIALVRPQRLLFFGQNGISTLLRHDSANNAPLLPSLNHEGAKVPALTAYDLESIVARPALKAGLWNRWLDWMPAWDSDDAA